MEGDDAALTNMSIDGVQLRVQQEMANDTIPFMRLPCESRNEIYLEVLEGFDIARLESLI